MKELCGLQDYKEIHLVYVGIINKIISHLFMLHRQQIEIPSLRQKFSHRNNNNCYKSIDYIRQNDHRSPKASSNRYYTMSIAQPQQFLPNSKVSFKRKNHSFSFQQERKKWMQLQKQQISQIKRQFSINHNRNLNKLSPISEQNNSNSYNHRNMHQGKPVLRPESINTYLGSYRQIIDRVTLQNEKSQLNGLQQAKAIYMNRALLGKRTKTQQIQRTMNILDLLPNVRSFLNNNQALIDELQKDLIHENIFNPKSNISKQIIRLQAFHKVNNKQKQVKHTKKFGQKKQSEKILGPWDSSKTGTKTLFFQGFYSKLPK